MQGESGSDEGIGVVRGIDLLRHISVLRSIGILSSADDDGDRTHTLLSDVRQTRDIRILGPVPVSGIDTFVGRLGREIARRRAGATLTLLQVGRPLSETQLQQERHPDPGATGPFAAPSRTGTGGQGPTHPGVGREADSSTREPTRLFDPSPSLILRRKTDVEDRATSGDRGQVEAKERDTESRTPSPSEGPGGRRFTDAASGASSPGESAAGTARETGPAREPSVTPGESWVRRIERLTGVSSLPGRTTSAPSHRRGRSVGEVETAPVGTAPERAEVTGIPSADVRDGSETTARAATPSSSKTASAVPPSAPAGSSERVVGLHDVSVLHPISEPTVRGEGPTVHEGRGSTIRRRVRWHQTRQRQETRRATTGRTAADRTAVDRTSADRAEAAGRPLLAPGGAGSSAMPPSAPEGARLEGQQPGQRSEPAPRHGPPVESPPTEEGRLGSRPAPTADSRKGKSPADSPAEPVRSASDGPVAPREGPGSPPPRSGSESSTPQSEPYSSTPQSEPYSSTPQSGPYSSTTRTGAFPPTQRGTEDVSPGAGSEWVSTARTTTDTARVSSRVPREPRPGDRTTALARSVARRTFDWTPDQAGEIGGPQIPQEGDTDRSASAATSVRRAIPRAGHWIPTSGPRGAAGDVRTETERPAPGPDHPRDSKEEGDRESQSPRGQSSIRHRPADLGPHRWSPKAGPAPGPDHGDVATSAHVSTPGDRQWRSDALASGTDAGPAWVEPAATGPSPDALPSHLQTRRRLPPTTLVDVGGEAGAGTAVRHATDSSRGEEPAGTVRPGTGPREGREPGETAGAAGAPDVGTQRQPAGTAEDHTGAAEEHARAAEEYTGVTEDHPGISEERARAAEEYTGVPEEHPGISEERAPATRDLRVLSPDPDRFPGTARQTQATAPTEEAPPTVRQLPALTHQDSTGVGPAAAERSRTGGSTAGTAGGRTTPSSESDWPAGIDVGQDRRETGRRSRRAGTADRRSASSRLRAAEADRQVPTRQPDRGTADRPDLDVQRPAPTVDATRGEEVVRQHPPGEAERRSDRRSRQPSGPRAEPDVAAETERALEETFFGSGPEPSVYSADVDRIVDRLYREVERKMQIERERRGL